MFPERNSCKFSGGRDVIADSYISPLTRRRLGRPFVEIRSEVRETGGAGATPMSATVNVTI